MVAAWDVGRLLELGGMWVVMTMAMLAPCGAVSMALSRSEAQPERRPTPHPSRPAADPPSPSRGEGRADCTIPVSTPSPLEGGGARRADEGWAVGLTLLVAIAATLHWGLESAALLGSVPVAAALLGTIVLLEWRKWTTPSPLLASVQMAALTLLGPPMDVRWMAVVTLWMLADALLDRRALVKFADSTLGPIVRSKALH